MRIGIASPLSCYYFQDYLYPESAEIASRLSNYITPIVTGLVVSFLRQGHDIVAFTKDSKAKKYYKLSGPNLVVYVIPTMHKGWRKLLNKFLIPDIWLIATMLRSKEKLDVMSVQWTRDFAFGARRFFNVCPITVTVRDVIPVISQMQPISWSTKMWNELTMKESRYHLIANSEYTKDMIKKVWNRDSIVIHNCLSELFIDYHQEEKYKSFTYVSISASNDGRKNIINLLLAFKLIHREFPLTQLILIGPYFTDNNERIKEWRNRGLCDGVLMLGPQNSPQIKSILTKSHCLVHPSIEESFGNTLIEAMSCKCLVIGGEQSGAVPYVLKHGEIGLLCNVNDHISIKDSMIKAYNDDNDHIVNKAFEVVHAEYTPQMFLNNYIRYFEELICNFRKTKDA